MAFDTVLVYKLDRLGRDTRDTLNAVHDLETSGVQVRSLTEPFDTTTPAGRLMLTMLAGFARLERDTIIERSTDATKRLARDGVWLGGIVPYGYRVEGKDKDARLVVSEEPLPGINMTEADVVRSIFRQLADDRKSCPEIADLLNGLGVPPAYAKGRSQTLERETETGDSRHLASRPHPSLANNTTYMGLHRYGKRSKRRAEPIERQVPQIVDVENMGTRPEDTENNRIIARNPQNRQYLLRGLIKCGVCGLTYTGVGWRGTGDEMRTYYNCNGRQAYRGIYGSKDTKCPSKAISGDIEDQVWSDIVEFGRNPGAILEELAQAQQRKTVDRDRLNAETNRLERAIQHKTTERDQVIGWARRLKISEADMDGQLGQIQLEEAELKRNWSASRNRPGAPGGQASN